MLDLPPPREDRRRRPSVLTPGMESGWLCFESEREKRRLAPVPPDWEVCPDEALEGYLEAARAIRRRPLETPPDLPPTPAA